MIGTVLTSALISITPLKPGVFSHPFSGKKFLSSDTSGGYPRDCIHFGTLKLLLVTIQVSSPEGSTYSEYVVFTPRMFRKMRLSPNTWVPSPSLFLMDISIC